MSNDPDVNKVLTGFLALTQAQRDELVKDINDLQSGRTTDGLLKRSMESIVESNTINFGPSPSGCPCCGK